MKYIVVEWNNASSDEPVLFYSELDDAGWEQRKVEMYRNGHQGFADKLEEFGDSKLGLIPLPELKYIALDLQFVAREIPKEKFEAVWLHRRERLDMK